MRLLSSVLGVVLWPFRKLVELVKAVLCRLFGRFCPKAKEAAKVAKEERAASKPKAEKAVAKGKDKPKAEKAVAKGKAHGLSKQEEKKAEKAAEKEAKKADKKEKKEKKSK